MEWVPAALSLAGVVAVAVIGGRNARRTALVTATTPAYAELVEEVRQYRRDSREDRERIDQLEDANRALEKRTRCMEKALDDRDRITRAMAEFIDSLGEWLTGGQRGKVPRPSAVLHDHIQADLWHSDPHGIPAVPDDGQPFDPTH